MTIIENQLNLHHTLDNNPNNDRLVVFWSFLIRFLLLLSFYFLGAYFFSQAAASTLTPTPADTMIRNRASVTFKPSTFEPAQRQESNEVEVRVAAVEALSLTNSQTINSAPNAPFAISHTLVNTGNVASTYQFTLLQQAGFIASNLKLIWDVNNNGKADAGESILPSNGSVATTIPALSPGASVSLLVVATVPTTAVAPDTSQIKLSAVTVLQSVSAHNTDVIRLVTGPVFSLSKSSNKPNKALLPGEEMSYDVAVNNIGSSNALALPKANNTNAILLNTGESDPAGLFNIRIDGVLTSKVILRDHIPIGTTYAGDLSSPNNNPGKELLFRMAGDAPFAYQRTAGLNVIEVAVAFDSVPANASVRMSFKVKVKADYEGEIVNIAELFYSDGTSSILSQSAYPTNQVRNTTPIGPSPDLIIKKTHNADFIVDQESRFQIIVENVSQLATTQAVVVTDLLPAEMQFVSATGVGWSCTVAGKLVTCVLAKGLPASTIYSASKSSPITLIVKIAASVLNGTSGSKKLLNTATVQGGGEATSRTKNNSSTDEVLVIQPTATSSLKGRVWLDVNHDRVLQNNEAFLKGWYVELLQYQNATQVQINAAKNANPTTATDNTFINAASQKPIGTTFVIGTKIYTIVARSAETDEAGSYAINNIAAGNNYALRFYSPQGIWYSSPVDGELAQPISNAVVDHDLGMLTAIVFTGGQQFKEQSLPVDHTGVVYDSLKRTPVQSAQLTLVGPNGFDPSIHLVGGLSNFNQLTDPTGVYHYSLTSFAPVGTYRIQITSPVNYSWPSVIIPPQANALAIELGAPDRYIVQNQETAPNEAQNTIYYLSFEHNASSKKLTNNHIPLDPPFESGPWVVEKKANKTTVEVVDFVDYTIGVTNKTKLERSSLIVFDQAATGFTYVEKSAFITLPGQKKIAIQPRIVNNGKSGFYLQFDINLPLSGSNVEKILLDEVITIQYRMAVSPNAMLGDGVNTAWAQSIGPNPASSNKANAKVKIIGGVFANEGFIVGSVFLDCNKTGAQEKDETGIPGVRLFLEDGTHVMTDALGKFSFYGVSPTTHILKLDETSVPKNTFFGATGNRASGLPFFKNEPVIKNATSQFIDLKNGQLFQANFAAQTCNDNILQVVEQRKIIANPINNQEIVTAVKSSERFTIVSQNSSDIDVKAKPSAGFIDLETQPVNLTNTFNPLSNSVASKLKQEPSTELEVNQLLTLEEKVKQAKDNTFELLNLTDQQILEFAYTNIQVKGPIGTIFKLWVNDIEIPDSRVGKRSTLADKKVEAWEYVAVTLKKGVNTIKVLQNDPLGNTRGSKTLQIIAPGDLAKISLELPKDALADGQTAAIIKMRLLDSEGRLVSTRTPINLSTKIGEWLVNDLSAQEPGIQLFVQGGQIDLPLRAPVEPGVGEIVIDANGVKTSAEMRFTPNLRPMLVAGLVDGVIHLRNINFSAIEPVRKADSFEKELVSFSQVSQNGKKSVAARAAFYLKGKIKGEYLLTAAYDSEKTQQETLFRDIQPDAFYPIYGDSSIRGFDAQSSGKLYVRIDSQRSYLMWGDFTPVGNNIRQLTQYSRALNGAQLHVDEIVAKASSTADSVWSNSSDVRSEVNVFASKNNQKQVLEELLANGTTGPFQLRFSDMLQNSEKIEVLIRDRQQNEVLSSNGNSQLVLERFVDYTIDTVTGQLRLRQPLASFDQNGNRQSIRIRYEVEGSGDEFWVAGIDTQIELMNKAKLGVVGIEDKDPAKPSQLQGVYASVKLAEQTTLNAEVAKVTRYAGNGTDSTAIEKDGQSVSGIAQRVELVHQSNKVQIKAQAQKSDKDFDFTGSSLSKGRQELTLEASAKPLPQTTVKAQLKQSKNLIELTEQTSSGVSATQQLTPGISVELGIRHYRNLSNEVLTRQSILEEGDIAKLRIAGTLPMLTKVNSFVEYEQDLSVQDQKLLAFGSEYNTNWGRVYGRYELISSLNKANNLNLSAQNQRSAIGFDAKYSDAGSVYSEYRLSNEGSDTTSNAQLAYGLKHQFNLTNAWSLTGNFEKIQPTDSSESVDVKPTNTSVSSSNGTGLSSTERSTTAGLTLDYKGYENARLSSRIEARFADLEKSNNFLFAAAYKLNNEWSSLARLVQENRYVLSQSGSDAENTRVQLGLAYRPNRSDRLNVLAKYENRYEITTPVGLTDDLGTLSRSQIVSVHANIKPYAYLQLDGRIAAKWIRSQLDTLVTHNSAQLIYARATYDLSNRLDIATQFFWMRSNNGALQKGVGLELGYLISSDVWLSLGYNAFGFKEFDLAGDAQLSKGAYLRLRVKFDETGLKW